MAETIPLTIHSIANKLHSSSRVAQLSGKTSPLGEDSNAANAKIPEMREIAEKLLAHDDIGQVPLEMVSDLTLALETSNDGDTEQNRAKLFIAIDAICKLEIKKERELTSREKDFLARLDGLGIKYTVKFSKFSDPELHDSPEIDEGPFSGNQLTALADKADRSILRIQFNRAFQEGNQAAIHRFANELYQSYMDDSFMNYPELIQALSQENLAKVLEHTFFSNFTKASFLHIGAYINNLAVDKNVYQITHHHFRNQLEKRQELIKRLTNNAINYADEKPNKSIPLFISFIQTGVQYEEQNAIEGDEQIFTQIKKDLIDFSESSEGYGTYNFRRAFTKAAKS